MSKTDGFEFPNTTPVPDIVFDKLLGELTGNELKVLLYIIRRTYGFGKNADAISLSQFRRGIMTKDKKVLDSGCGLEHNRTILVALASLEQKGYVIANKGQTNSGDADTTIYKLRFKVAAEARASEKVVTSSNYVVTPGNEGSYSTSPRWLPQVTTVVTPGNPQETVIQQTDSQETVIQEEREAFAFAHDARAFSETENENDSYRHDHTRKDDAWRCEAWRNAHDGASCEDYQAWIDGGGRDAPTDKQAAVKIGVTDGPHAPLRPAGDHRTGAAAAALGPGGHPAGQVAIASTSGEAASPPVALARQSHTLSSLSDVDGAVKSGGNVTRPRASDEHTTPVSLNAASATSPPAAQMAAGAVTQASILADWEAIQGQPQAWTDRHYKAARQGVRASPTREELAGCRAWLPTTDNPKTLWYHSHGVELWDVIEKLNAYRSHLALSIEPAPLADMPKPKPMDVYTANSLDKEKMKRRVAEMKANAAKKGLQVPHHGTN